MVNAISGGLNAYANAAAGNKRSVDAVDNESGRDRDTSAKRIDELVLSGGGQLNDFDKANLVVERALDKLRAVVGDARQQLGLPENAVIDTSPDATAGRIADFALGFFNQYAKKNGLEDNEEGRKAFADFIGGAISQGIEQARGILGSLNALDGNTSSNIDKTSDIIQQKLDDFVKNGRTPQAPSI